MHGPWTLFSFIKSSPVQYNVLVCLFFACMRVSVFLPFLAICSTVLHDLFLYLLVCYVSVFLCIFLFLPAIYPSMRRFSYVFRKQNVFEAPFLGAQIALWGPIVTKNEFSDPSNLWTICILRNIKFSSPLSLHGCHNLRI